MWLCCPPPSTCAAVAVRLVLVGLAAWPVRAGEPAAPPASAPAADRYEAGDPRTLTVRRRPVRRKDYVDLVRPLARGFEAGPDRGTYGPRHALPALAVYALEGDAKLGEGIKKTLRHYGDWVDKCVAQDQGVFSMEGPTLCCFAFRELRKRGQMTPNDEAWAIRRTRRASSAAY